jgi:hypothetical protein
MKNGCKWLQECMHSHGVQAQRWWTWLKDGNDLAQETQIRGHSNEMWAVVPASRAKTAYSERTEWACELENMKLHNILCIHAQIRLS